MSRRAMLLLAVLLTALLSSASHAASEPAVPVKGSRPPNRESVRLLSSTESSVSFVLDVPWQSLSIEPVFVAGRDYVRPSMPGWSTTGAAGYPALPMLARSIGVPFGVALAVHVVPGPAHVVKLPAPVLPVASTSLQWYQHTLTAGASPLPEPTVTIEANPAAYASSAPYPGVLAAIGSGGVVRQQRVAGIVAYPLQYQPAVRELTVYEWLAIEVVFEGAFSSVTAATDQSPESGPFEDLFHHEIMNYETARQWRRRVSSAPSFPSPGKVVDAVGAGVAAGWVPPVPGWRVKVRTDGMYRLTYEDLVAAGLPLGTLDPRTLQLFTRGTEAAVYVAGEDDGRFDAGDYLVFYGQALNSKYTADNVYWLTYGRQPGLRMGVRDGSPAAGVAPAFYRASRHFEANQLYRNNIPGDESVERWLWDYIYAPEKPDWSHTFSLPAPFAGEYTARLRIAMLGGFNLAVNPDHHTKVYVNGTQVEDVRWDGAGWRVAEIGFPQGLLVPGNNTISLACPNDTGTGEDLVYVDWAELEYADTFEAGGGALSFNYEAAGTWQFQVDGLASDLAVVVDVTDPTAVTRLGPVSTSQSGPPYSVSFRDTVSAAKKYWVGTTSTYLTPLAIEPDTTSELRSTSNGADYIIVTHSAFLAQVAQLAGYRAQHGLRTAVVDVQDAYDEFGYGLVEPAAIHDFLAYAYDSWQSPAPSYVVLFGDGHYDPKDYLGQGRVEFVPPYLAPVDPWIGETAADNQYVTLVGDDALPDMMLGRLSVNSQAEASAVVNKLIGYENEPPGGWQQQVLAVADNRDSAGSFDAISDALLENSLPAPFAAEKVYYGVTHTDLTSARAAIRTGISAGKLIVNYVGHAAVTAWASEGLFRTSDVPLLQNGLKLPVILPMTCYDGYFHYPYPYSEGTEATAEMITRADGRGAVASWSPTGLGSVAGHESLDQGFFDAVFSGRQRTLGGATTAGKLRLWATGVNLDLLDTYLLFGDPATRLPLAPTAAPVPPLIAIRRSVAGSGALLSWLNRQEDPFYEVWRGTEPYFEPLEEMRNQIVFIYGEPYGVMGQVRFTDDGTDRYSRGSGDPLLAAVRVFGDAAANYFWVVRGRNGDGVSENSNRVGEFEYALVPGR